MGASTSSLADAEDTFRRLSCSGLPQISADTDVWVPLDVFAQKDRSDVMEQVCNPQRPAQPESQAAAVLLNERRKEVAKPAIEPHTVILHIYDLNKGFKVANHVLSFSAADYAMGGAFHVGVEAFGSEWSYGIAGVSCNAPRTVEGHIYRCSMVLGNTTMVQWVMALHELCQTWLGGDYDMLSHNCCSFAAELCRRLDVGPLPSWVDRFARLLSSGRTAGAGVVQAADKVGRKAVDKVGQLLQCGVASQQKALSQREPELRVDRDLLPELRVDGDLLVGAANPYTAFENGGTLTLPHSQIRVQGQKVSMEPTSPQKGVAADKSPDQDASMKAVPNEPVFVEWRDPQDNLSEHGCSQEPAESDKAGEEHKAPREDVKQEEPVQATDQFESAEVPPKIEERAPKVEEQEAVTTQPAASMTSLPPADQEQELDQKAAEPTSKLEEAATLIPQGTIKLDAVSALGDTIDLGTVAAGLFPVGSQVEYHSATQNIWIPATVLAFYPEMGLYDLTVKQRAMPERIRWQTSSGLEAVKEEGPRAPITMPLGSLSSLFPVGTSVEYESTSAEGCWIPAKVVAIYPETGLYDLDCKQQVFQQKVRTPDSFPVGAAVEYRSTSTGQGLGWIPAQVMAFHENSGLYDLSCKANAPRRQIRWPQCTNQESMPQVASAA